MIPTGLNGQSFIIFSLINKAHYMQLWIKIIATSIQCTENQQMIVFKMKLKLKKKINGRPKTNGNNLLYRLK